MKQHTLSNSSGLQITILNYGGIIQSIKTRQGDNLVLGFTNTDDYPGNKAYFGAIIGRVANRIANAQFNIGDRHYRVEANENGKQCLHSGSSGLHSVFWNLTFLPDENAVRLDYLSRDGEGGFPGNVNFKVSYQLTNDNQLIIDYTAKSDQITPIVLTNHTYWDLSTHDTILNQYAKFCAEQYLPLDTNNIPLGDVLTTKNSILDFSAEKRIGENIDQLTQTKGYDYYYILNKAPQRLRLAAEITDRQAKRQLRVLTTQPGFQFYTGNFLANPYSGLCIETQGYPNAINQTNFPSPLLQANQIYHHKTIFQLIIN